MSEVREGLVQKKRLWSGTKSEHDGVVLVTEDGEYKLRRQGGNPFHDEALDPLVGQRIRCECLVREQQIIMTSWVVI